MVPMINSLECGGQAARLNEHRSAAMGKTSSAFAVTGDV
jgi:hypothetical protein